MREPILIDDSVTLYQGDCIEVMAEMDESCIDAIVCDPPYGLGFMGKEWDKIGDTGRGAYARTERADEVTPEGEGHSTSAGPYLAVGVDSLRSAGAPFQEWCFLWATQALRILKPGGHLLAFGGTRTYHRLTCGIEDAGFEIRDCLAWLYGQGFPKSLNLGDGRGTALKPAFEPIVVARKPLIGTVAANIEAHNTGTLNIDACRIASDDDTSRPQGSDIRGGNFVGSTNKSEYVSESSPLGRWPANVVLDERAAEILDEQTGMLTSGDRSGHRNKPKTKNAFGSFELKDELPSEGDSGGASRFFYTAKASKTDRGEGNDHPTVKPVDLMRWLVRLVTPPDGVVLDCFAGSGSTLRAAISEQRTCVGIEQDEHYCEIIKNRLDRPIPLAMFDV